MVKIDSGSYSVGEFCGKYPRLWNCKFSRPTKAENIAHKQKCEI